MEVDDRLMHELMELQGTQLWNGKQPFSLTDLQTVDWM